MKNKMRVTIRNDQIEVDGYVNAVGRDSRLIQGYGRTFREYIEPGTFQKAIDRADGINVLLNHDEKRKLSSTSEGFELYEDNIGLRAKGIIKDAEVIEKARNDRLVGWSFGFYSVEGGDTWEKIDETTERRRVHDIVIDEVSILDDTRIPAYYGTSIETRDEHGEVHETRVNRIETDLYDESFDDSIYELRLRRLKLEL